MDKGAKGQGDKGTKKQRDKRTKGQKDKGLFFCLFRQSDVRLFEQLYP